MDTDCFNTDEIENAYQEHQAELNENLGDEQNDNSEEQANSEGDEIYDDNERRRREPVPLDDVLDEPFEVLLLDVVPLDDVLPLLEADVPLPVLPVADHDWLFDDVLFSSLGDVSIDNSGVCTGSSLTAGVEITLVVDTTATDGAGVSSILFPPLTLDTR